MRARATPAENVENGVDRVAVTRYDLGYVIDQGIDGENGKQHERLRP